MRILKVLLIPAALAFAPAAALAAPAPPGGTASTEVGTGIEATPAHYRTYYHTHYYAPPQRYRQPRYAPHRYNYRPRCYWSNYYQRRVCR